MLNRTVMIGRLTRDPELKYTPSGTAVCTFSIAVGRTFQTDVTDYFDIVVWRKMGENCANYLSKGKLVAVDGSLQVRSYETKDGSKRKAYEIVAETVKFLSPKDEQAAPAEAQIEPVADDDLPF